MNNIVLKIDNREKDLVQILKTKNIPFIKYIEQGWQEFCFQGPYFKNNFERGPHFLAKYCYM